MSADPEGRRGAKRFPAELPVELHIRGESLKIRTLDVAQHGLFLATERALMPSFLVRITVHLPGGPFNAMATVAHAVAPGGEAEAGAGVKFYCLASKAKERWDAYIAGLDGSAIPLKPRNWSGGSASFLVQPDTLVEVLEFFTTHVAAGELVYVTPPIRQTGADIDVIMVHPDTSEEFIFAASVEEFDPAVPTRMGIRFGAVDASRHDEFMAFAKRTPGERPLPDPRHPPLHGTFRRQWREYAFFSPKVWSARKQRETDEAEAAQATQAQPDTPLESAEPPLEVVEGVLIEPPEQIYIDREQLFDFDWLNEVQDK